MYEKILQKLKEQRGTTSNVSDRSLEDLAKTLVPLVATEEALAPLDFSPAIQSLDGNINSYTANQVTKTKEELAKAKAKETTIKKPEKKAEGEDQTNDFQKQLMEKMTAMEQEINSFKVSKTTNSRKEVLKKTLEGMPAFFIEPIIGSFETANFESEETFTAYNERIAQNVALFKQAAKESGLNTFVPSAEVEKPKTNGETPELNKAREIVKLRNKQLENATNK